MKIKNSVYFRGIFLSLLLVFSLFSTPLLMDVHAQTSSVVVESLAFEKTTIIEFENNSNDEINEVRVWLPEEYEFQSFKSEEGWTGEKNSAGVVVFTTETPIKPGEVVKFGIKTDKIKPKISWKTLENEKQVAIGVSEPKDIESPIQSKPQETQEVTKQEKETAIFEMSSFKLVPEKPKVGDSIRVVGTSFAADEILNFYIDGKRIVAFETDPEGNFVLTSEIPDNLKASRIDFTVKDSYANEKNVSLRVSPEENRMAAIEKIPLTMEGLPDILHRGDTVKITGTAHPGSTVTAEIIGPEGNLITSEPRPVNVEGNWDFETLVPQDTPYGKYEAIVSDGTESIDVSWKVESSKIIEMTATTLIFEPGELMKFNGTAIPNESIEFILENPQGIEIASDIKEVEKSGYVEFTYQTEQSTTEGTYVLFAKQRDSTEIILTGLGERPKEHIIAKLDKLNYKKSDIATVSIDGPISATLSLLVVDPSDKEKFLDNQVVLQPDGKLDYELDLKDWSSGVYTLVLSRANTKTSEVFSVGLQFGSGQIEVGTTKSVYEENDPILILGETNANVLVTLQLIDPDGDIIKEKETFTNKEGRLSDGSFRIPSESKPGLWQIKATSGPNFATTELEVVATAQEGMLVVIEGVEHYPGIGDVVNFKILGAKNNVEIVITDQDGDVIDQLSFPASSSGDIDQPWPVKKDLPPGTYTLTASDAFDSASAEFVLE